MSENFKFGKVGDYIKGTLLKVDKTTSKDKYGKYSYSYTVKAKEGLFYNSSKDPKTNETMIDKDPTTINDGDEYTIFISEDKGVVVGKMKDGKVGAKFMIKFDELKPSSKGHPAKIIKVFWAKDNDGNLVMDEQWLAENESVEDFG